MDVKISLDTPVEELIERFPEAVSFLLRRSIRCIGCGEPLWCTLGELLKEEGIENPQNLLDELNKQIKKSEENSETSK